jgi:hypothetical protein
MIVINKILVPLVHDNDPVMYWILFESTHPRQVTVLTDSEVDLIIDTVQMIRESEKEKGQVT